MVNVVMGVVAVVLVVVNVEVLVDVNHVLSAVVT